MSDNTFVTIVILASIALILFWGLVDGIKDVIVFRKNTDYALDASAKSNQKFLDGMFSEDYDSDDNQSLHFDPQN